MESPTVEKQHPESTRVADKGGDKASGDKWQPRLIMI